MLKPSEVLVYFRGLATAHKWDYEWPPGNTLVVYHATKEDWNVKFSFAWEGSRGELKTECTLIVSARINRAVFRLFKKMLSSVNEERPDDDRMLGTFSLVPEARHVRYAVVQRFGIDSLLTDDALVETLKDFIDTLFLEVYAARCLFNYMEDGGLVDREFLLTLFYFDSLC